ncbi:MAG: hypothetical protein ACPGU3_05840 [Litorivicinus sp.]
MQHPASEQILTLRDPQQVMRLARMGSFHASRLSFMRILLRRLKSEHWQFKRTRWQMDARGEGVAVYQASGPARTYSLVAFGHDLPDEMRSDRVIAQAWDATFTLFDGVPSDQDIERLRANVPVQEAGRVTQSELSLSRANRSVRLWQHVVDRLSQGLQPEASELDAVGYLMRTTAVYGSGKFGAADREVIADRAEFNAPFQAEMLSVLMIRQFARDWVEHAARQVGGEQAVTMDDALARRLGIGNSTGLGMAPFLLNHPVLLNNWIQARETAIAQVCAIESPSTEAWDQVQALIRQQRLELDYWPDSHPIIQARLPGLAQDLQAIDQWMGQHAPHWQRLMDYTAEHCQLEAQELTASLILEPYPQVDELAPAMAADEANLPVVDGSRSVTETLQQIEARYGWALNIDWDCAEAQSHLWYVSEEKLEPRLAMRQDEPLDAYEQPLAPGRDMAYAWQALKDSDARTLAEFLLRHPQHRGAIQRLQWLQQAPYGEILDNTTGHGLLPIDLLRCKLSFFGASRFDPRSDRWVRICMYRNGPYLHEVASHSDQWVYGL